ncbi:Helicase superfamily 1/2, ATP-binding domain [Fusarium oxysporum f. sp. vasinfectum]|nr:Helicase superfamily 1/2, ATP-binding domain [Fusarium oxysporum f. sp. vasinfectum]
MAQNSLKRGWPFEEYGGSSSTATPTPSFEQISDIPDEYTCFGSIIGEEAQLGQQVHPQNLLSQSFNVVKEGDYFALWNGVETFARLTKGMSRKLHTLYIGPYVRLRAYFPKDAVDTTSWLMPTSLPVEINLYGARDNAEKVGAILSETGTFLQFPKYGRDNIEYYNPHFFRVEGHSEKVPIETFLPSRPDHVEISGQAGAEEVEGGASAVVETILDHSLSHRSIQRGGPVDGRIMTVLLPHQKEAIDFVSGREIGNIPTELSLWRYNDMDADEPLLDPEPISTYRSISLTLSFRSYQHIFTGARRPNQEEAEGGIIADDMGLGKSLVILSTIAGSLNRAQKFVASENQLISNGQQSKTPSRATLILAPSSLLIGNWIAEVRKHTCGSLSVHQHLRRERHKETQLLFQRDIVFSTYATVATEFSRGQKALANINWFRIVLDEAHDIRNRQTNQFRAVTRLSGKHRWCLTGTPIQNSLEDLGALVSFLKVPVLEKPSTFRKFITSPIALSSNDGFRNLQTLLQTICIRRTKQLLGLPPPMPITREVYLTPPEWQEYDKIMQQAQQRVQEAVSGHTKNKINSIVLESLLKLRLFCNNGSANNVLEMAPTGLPSDSDEALAYLQQHELNCRFIHGGCSLTQRRKMLEEFQMPHGPGILLMTLGTGAVGLNLEVASRIFLLEPQWNPSIEDQAIGRALRLGQTTQVKVIRYIVKNTIEEAGVLSRQRRKIQLAGEGFAKRKDMPPETLQSLLHAFKVDGASVS